MTTNEIGTVIGMVCDKVGLAVNQVQPLAEEVVRQYQARAMAWLIVCSTVIVTAVIVLRVSVRKISVAKEPEVADILAAIFAGTALLIASVAFCANIGDYFAPLCGLIGK
jgi:hypothetical protein